MSTTYKTTSKDYSFDTISRKLYGHEGHSDRIRRANPGVLEPITAGVTVNIPPPLNRSRVRRLRADPNKPNEVQVFIGGRRFRYWDNIRIMRNMGTVDVVEFTAPFDPDNTAQREWFKPLQFKTLEVTVGDAQLFTGTLVTVAPETSAKGRTVSLGGYSKPGVMSECSAPIGSEAEFNNQPLSDIAQALADPFGVTVAFEAIDDGAAFERVAVDVGNPPMKPIVDLARQRGFMVASTEAGELLFWTETTDGEPVARLVEGKSPLVSIEPFFSEKDYHSHVTGVEPMVVDGAGGSFTVKNSRLAGVHRPFAFKIKDAAGGDVQTATKAQAGKMFANAVRYSAEVATWRDPGGNLWRPNTYITVKAPGAMIYNEYKFLIRSVELSKDSGAEVSNLDLVLPGSFNGNIPEDMPWDY